MRMLIIVLIILALVGLTFGWLLDAQAGAAAVSEFLSGWAERFQGAE